MAGMQGLVTAPVGVVSRVCSLDAADERLISECLTPFPIAGLPAWIVGSTGDGYTEHGLPCSEAR